MERDKEIDPVDKCISGFGRWQFNVFMTIGMLKFPCAWHQLSILFLDPKIDFWCIEPEGFNGTLQNCDPRCLGHKYDKSVFTETITTEWNLICSRATYGPASQTIFMFGMLIGSIVFSYFADKNGRRIPLVTAVILQFVSGVATAFSQSFWLFCLLRFFLAVATAGTMLTGFVLLMEVIGADWRESISILHHIPSSLGHLSLPLFGYFIRDWRKFQLAVSIPTIALVSYYWLIPESPRWLIQMGKIERAEMILTKAAKTNKLPTDEIRENIAALVNAHKPKPRGEVMDLIRTPNMRKKTLIICFDWFVCGIAFFGISLLVGRLSGNIFINIAISAALTMPGTLLSIYCTKALGRKNCIVFSNTLTGASLIVLAFIPQTYKIVIVTLASIGCLGISITTPIAYLYSGELFPTVVRNIGMGAASMAARIGSMIAPFIVSEGKDILWLPPIIFGITTIIGALLTLLLPETKDTSLPETIEDGENFGKKLNKDKGKENSNSS